MTDDPAFDLDPPLRRQRRQKSKQTYAVEKTLTSFAHAVDHHVNGSRKPPSP